MMQEYQEQNICTVLYYTTVLCTLDLITFKGISTQFTQIHVDGAILQTSQHCTHSLHVLTTRHNKADGWLKKMPYTGFSNQTYNLVHW